MDWEERTKGGEKKKEKGRQKSADFFIVTPRGPAWKAQSENFPRECFCCSPQSHQHRAPLLPAPLVTCDTPQGRAEEEEEEDATWKLPTPCAACGRWASVVEPRGLASPPLPPPPPPPPTGGALSRPALRVPSLFFRSNLAACSHASSSPRSSSAAPVWLQQESEACSGTIIFSLDARRREYKTGLGNKGAPGVHNLGGSASWGRVHNAGGADGTFF